MDIEINAGTKRDGALRALLPQLLHAQLLLLLEPSLLLRKQLLRGHCPLPAARPLVRARKCAI